MKSTILIFFMPSFVCCAVSFYMQITSYHLLIGWAVEIQHLTSRTPFFVGFFFEMQNYILFIHGTEGVSSHCDVMADHEVVNGKKRGLWH